jgi:hypothetical protein
MNKLLLGLLAGDAAKEFADEVDKGFEKVRTTFNGAAQ